MSNTKMLKRFGGGERPETKADRDAKERQAMAERDADAAGAFAISADMEGPLQEITLASAALRIIADSDGLEEGVADALYGLLGTLHEATKNAEDMRKHIFHKTWAYRHGSANATAAASRGA